MKSVLDPNIQSIFGPDDADFASIEPRARRAFPDAHLIVWEGDPQTFQFSQVAGDSEVILGYQSNRWLDPGFWSEVVVHPKDRSAAEAFCALATGSCKDHVFEYRAMTTAREVVWLRDFVRVIKGPRGVPVLLRGLMVELPKGERDPEFVGPTALRPDPATMSN